MLAILSKFEVGRVNISKLYIDRQIWLQQRVCVEAITMSDNPPSQTPQVTTLPDITNPQTIT